MHLVKLIKVDNNEYISSESKTYVHANIAEARMFYHAYIRDWVRETYGSDAAEFKIIDILKLDQCASPKVDGLLFYRLESDPEKIHIYQRKTEVITLTGWTGKYEDVATTFKRIYIFELENFDKLQSGSQTFTNQHHEMVDFGKIKAPRLLTEAPLCDLIIELKNSDKFKKRFDLCN